MNYLLNNHTIINKFLLFVLTGLCLLSTISANESALIIKSEGMELKVEEIASGLGIPWGMAFLSPDKLLVTERMDQG